jgi:hypothetical protein
MSRRLFASIALPPTLVLVAMALLSLRWRVTHDAPIMLYMAYLVDHGHAVPYRDFFDMNLPGSYWLYALLGRVSGYGDFGLRVADLVCLGGLSWTTFAWLRRIGWQPAWASAVLFGLVYLDGGPMLSFQREYLLLLPISAAALLAGTERWDARARGRDRAPVRGRGHDQAAGRARGSAGGRGVPGRGRRLDLSPARLRE